jgi:subtilisin family serine protease
LIMPELGTVLSSDTVKKYGQNGLEWYASAISADRIKSSDLSLRSTIRIGVIDAGVDTSHIKLQPFFWKIPVSLPHVPWQPGSIGYDYVAESSDPSEDSSRQLDGSLESHGTHITGLVASRGLAEWLPSIAALNLQQYIQIYSLKVAVGRSGSIPDFTLPGQALHDGLPNQIHLFNLSLVGPRSPMIRDDIENHRSDALLILAAGNDNKDLNEKANLHINGTFRHDDGSALDNVLFVAALMDEGSLTPKSNRGDSAVQIAAPGNNIWSTIQGGGFGALTGTSQAAPLVTATAAILLSEHDDAFPSEIKERILATCDWDEALERSRAVAAGCKLNMAKAIVARQDILELTARDANGQSLWLRGSVDKSGLQIQAVTGEAIDPTVAERIWFGDGGNVRVAVRGAGHRAATLRSRDVRVTLDIGEKCPTGTAVPCVMDVGDVRDIVFRWTGH